MIYKFSAQLAFLLRRMVNDEWPTKDPTMGPRILAALQSQDLRVISGALLAFYQVAAKFE
jgi:hypothetical protein